MKLVVAVLAFALVAAVAADDCAKCLAEVAYVKEHVDDDAYFNGLIGTIEDMCQDFPAHKADCVSKIEANKAAVRIAIKGMPAETLCKQAHLCESGEVMTKTAGAGFLSGFFRAQPDEDYCQPCLDGLAKAEHDCEDAAWQAKFHAVVDEVCDFLPEEAALCKATVTAGWQQIVDGFEHADVHTICHAIGVCASKSFSLNTLLYTLSNGQCDECKEYVSDLKTALPAQEGQILKDLHSICDQSGPEQSECNAAVDANVPDALKHIEASTADEICAEAHACVAPPAANGPMCDVCKKTVSDLQGELKKPDAKARVDKIAKDACALEPDYADVCMRGYNANYDRIVALIEGNTPEHVCAKAC